MKTNRVNSDKSSDKSIVMQLSLGVLCFLVAAFIRLNGITDDSLQTDERHWVSRSNQITKNIRSGRYSSATTHLGQPGAPPALLMAVGQWLGSKYNSHYNYQPAEPAYVQMLSSARIANATLSSLVVPVVFWTTTSLTGTAPAFLAASLLAVDPHHIALSRMAHVDSLLTLFVVVSTFLFIHSERRNCLWMKLLAGVFWGLSIATKPTAASLVLIFIIYKLLQSFLSKPNKPRFFISWGDVWAVVVGHITFALLYTRLWFHNSDYLVRLKIESFLADFVYENGIALSLYPVLKWVVVVAVVISSVFLGHNAYSKHRAYSKHGHCESSKLKAFHLNMSVLLCSAFLLTVIFVPQVLENIVRYWTWAVGLSGEAHKAYGTVRQAPAYGYVGLFLSQLPSIVLVGLLCGCLCSFSKIIATKHSDRSKEKFVLMVFMLIAAVIWTLPLSVSSKQTLRYVMPVIPFLYVLSAFGIFSLFNYLYARVSPQIYKQTPISWQSQTSLPKAVTTLLVGVVVIQTTISISWMPNSGLYFNKLSGGLSQAAKNGHPLYNAGINEILKSLRSLAIEKKEKVHVVVVGDLEVVKYSYKSIYNDYGEHVAFVPFKHFASIHYVLVFPSFRKMHGETFNQILSTFRKVTSFSWKNVEVISLHEVPFLEFKEPIDFPISKAYKHTGEHKALKTSVNPKVTIAKPFRNKRGYMFFGLNARLKEGHYEVIYPIGIPEGGEVDSSFGPERYAARVELGKNCSKIVSLGELREHSVTPIKLECDFDRKTRVALKVYWFGNIPVQLGSPTLRRNE